MPRLSDVGERQAIAILAKIFDRGHPVGLGHDCGVVEWGEDYLVITTDAVNPRTHVPEGASPSQVGWYLTAVNLSDIAAAGARPLGFVAALSLPAETDVDFLRGLGQGIEGCAREFGIPVLGGDTKQADVMSLAGTAIGRVRKDRVLLRKGARPGDVIVVTGELGRAGHAMRALSAGGGRSEALQTILHPYPRVAEGMVFSDSGAVTSCMDISDGLGATLAQMAAMTGLSYQVAWEALPKHKGIATLPAAQAKEIALYSGGDYELVATVRPEGLEGLLARYQTERRADRNRITLVGKVGPAGPNLLVMRDGREPLGSKGWEHFRPSK
ncbi:MAG: thiamine-phosphate kinase [Methanobacteriota archaeon]